MDPITCKIKDIDLRDQFIEETRPRMQDCA